MARASKNGTPLRLCFLALMTAILLAGCGGGNTGVSLMPAVSGGNAQGGKVIADSFALGEPGPETIAGLGLSVAESDGQVVVSVLTIEQQNLDAVLFELNYDAARYTPQVVQATDAYSPLSDCLCIEMLDTPGVVSFGQVSLHTNVKGVAAGDVLAEVLFMAVNCGEAIRVASDVPVHSGALCPLTYDSETGELKLYYANPGDFDQNGVVSVSDLVPLGRNFGESGPFPFESALSAIDGNSNGQIEVADLTIIGQNWGHNVERFNFYASDALSDVPVGYADPSTITPLGSAAFQAAIGDPLSDRLWFSYTVDSATASAIYWARPAVGDTEGICSNLAGPNMVTQPGSVSNALPSAQLALTHGELVTPMLATLDASASSDLDGVIAFYEWDFEGDGLYDAFGTAPVVTHVYAQAGTFAPLVRVTDNLGAWAIAQADAFTVTADVAPNVPPTADIFATTTAGEAPISVGFMASGSSDSDGYIAKYEWDFNGDGVYDLDSGSDPTVIHTYDQAGAFNATVHVTDERGDSDTDSVEIIVSDPPPPNEPPVAMLTADPLYGDAPLTVTLDASGSTDSDGSIEKYEWDFDGDGNFEEYGSATVVTYEYESSGVYTALVRVTDNAGAASSTEVEIRANAVQTGQGAWPSFGQNARNTRRSPYAGADTGDLKWTYSFEYGDLSSPAIGEGGVLYVGNSGFAESNLCALNADGSLRWSLVIDQYGVSSPLIGIDGTIYIASNNHNVSASDGSELENSLYAFHPDGSLKWSFRTNGEMSTPAIGIEGTVYVGSSQRSGTERNLIALDPEGSCKWSIPTGDMLDSSPAIGADGTVYICAGKLLYAINPDGTERWTFSTLSWINTGLIPYSSPSIGDDGTIYIGGGDRRIYAINPDGTEKWSYITGGRRHTTPAINVDQTLIVGCDDGKLYAINPDGSLYWTYTAGDDAMSSPAIGANGTIYVGNRGWPETNIHAVNSDGSLKWLSATDYKCTSPVLGPDGTVYAASSQILYAFGPSE